MEKMDITFAQYNAYEGENVSINAIIDGVTLSVPLDPANRHYAAIMQAVDAGELVILPAEVM